ncbi:PH domain-containing protein [Streptomyces sp. NPDC087894]|uniref:PH domain-containing protein n=1 Tax=Streptomyces sp. NPDC087894 TaxID=3365816 RepID=UPI00382221AC
MADAAWKAIVFPVPVLGLAVLYVLIGSDGIDGDGPSRLGVSVAIALSGCSVSLGWRMCFATRLDLDQELVRVVGVFKQVDLDVHSIKRVEWIEGVRNVTLRLSDDRQLSVGALSARSDIAEYLERMIESRKGEAGEAMPRREVRVDWRSFLYPSDFVAFAALAAALLIGVTS